MRKSVVLYTTITVNNRIMEFSVKIRKVNRITIPIDLIEYYDVREGDLITFDLVRVNKK